MSKIVILADLHGNITAAEAMENEINAVSPDEIWFLGDAVGKGPNSAETCDWVRKNCSRFVGGNWDYWVSDRNNTFKGNDFFRGQLGEERLKWLGDLPLEFDALISGIRFRLFHGRPAASLVQGWDSDEYMSDFFKANGKTYGGIICADSHRPFIRSTHSGYAVNTGSIGNNLGVPKAHALLVEGEIDCPEAAPLRMTILSVPYDNEAAAEIARRTEGLPSKEAYINEILTGVYSR
ncbi:MAG: metallophosphoesterase family protein [Ruminococcus sp.]|nr:metallophosphoesterase family protein [Ruminococcus sp.]